MINRVNDYLRIPSASRMSSSRSNISSEALTAFLPEMEYTSKLANSSVPTSPLFWIL
ncbi:unnamed protein product [Protopolystoma xenopodis]|uniref:Uncharacterized protein n=1 Tax=Protopolystoma xenopodis TaxID=117903 RepID=A0A3S5CNY4_9PLAT|nr:unnamed protein product [Protopolystoma xenopodis]